jgi:thiamine transporter ThiT
MNSEPVEDPRLRRFGLTRSLQDRLFVLFVGVLQMAFAYVCLSPLFGNRGATNTETETSLAIVRAVWVELLLAFLVLGASCVIWGIAAPKWLERLFSKALGHLWVVLMVICCCLLVALGYVLLQRV